MSQSIHCSVNNAEEKEEQEEEEEEIWLHELVCGALVELYIAYTLKCSYISLCLSSIALVES